MTANDPRLILLIAAGLVCFSCPGIDGRGQRRYRGYDDRCLNMTIDDVEYIALLVSDPFLNSFDIARYANDNDWEDTIDAERYQTNLTYPLTKYERRTLVRSIVANLNVHNDQHLTNSPCVRDIRHFAKSSRNCCSKRLCEFRHSLTTVYPSEIYSNSVGVLNKNYVYVSKFFCDTYLLILYDRLVLAAKSDYEIGRIMRRDIDADNFLYIFISNFINYLSINDMCKK